jgi:hypothetical protein
MTNAFFSGLFCKWDIVHSLLTEQQSMVSCLNTIIRMYIDWEEKYLPLTEKCHIIHGMKSVRMGALNDYNIGVTPLNVN